MQIRQASEPELIFGWQAIAVMLQGNMANDEDVSTWIGYIIVSNDVADQALIQEHRARSWAYAQTMQWVVGREGVTADAFEALQHENVLASELQLRIRARGFELMSAGAAPASEDQIAAWNATWVPLVSNLYDDATLGHWA